MGCAGSSDSNPNERAIVYAEGGLGFRLVDSQRVDYVLRKFSHQSKVSSTHIVKSSLTLPFHIKDYASHTKLTEFFDSWIAETDGIDVRDLLLLGLLLSLGDAEVKAKLIFQCFDESSGLAIDLCKVEEMLRRICKVCLKTAELVVDGQDSRTNIEDVMKYTQELAQAQEAAVLSVLQKFGPISGIRESTFVEVITKVQRGKLLTTTGWRSYMSEIALTKPKIYNFIEEFP